MIVYDHFRAQTQPYRQAKPAPMEDLIVFLPEELYGEPAASEAKRALAQSLGWVAGTLVQRRRLLGRVRDCSRARDLWHIAARMASQEVKSESQLDRDLDVETFAVALATEYSRLLLGPDTERLVAPLASDLLSEKERLVPRSGAVEQYGLRLVPDQKMRRLVQHADWLERVDRKGII